MAQHMTVLQTHQPGLESSSLTEIPSLFLSKAIKHNSKLHKLFPSGAFQSNIPSTTRSLYLSLEVHCPMRGIQSIVVWKQRSRLVFRRHSIDYRPRHGLPSVPLWNFSAPQGKCRGIPITPRQLSSKSFSIHTEHSGLEVTL
jgi:hypothetical protein